MIDAEILAAIAARLDRALAASPIRYRPLRVGAVDLGEIDDERAARLARFDAFRVDRHAVALHERLATCEARSAALADVATVLREEGALPAWRDELYAVAPAFGATTVFRVERGAARYFGVRTWAAHINGVTRRDGVPMMWLARRSPRKAVDPGLLDNLVGGGIAADMRVDQTVVKEAWEEAGIAADLARTARPAGVVHVRRALADGLQRETLFVHDLELPAHFVPANQDGEAIEHRLVAQDDVARAIAVAAGPDQMTVDASLVALDYLFRHGRIAPDQRHYLALDALRRRGADAADPP